MWTIFYSPQKLPAKQNKQKKATPFKNYLLPAHTKDKIPVLFEHFLLLKCLVTNKETCLSWNNTERTPIFRNRTHVPQNKKYKLKSTRINKKTHALPKYCFFFYSEEKSDQNTVVKWKVKLPSKLCPSTWLPFPKDIHCSMVARVAFWTFLYICK